MTDLPTSTPSCKLQDVRGDTYERVIDIHLIDAALVKPPFGLPDITNQLTSFWQSLRGSLRLSVILHQPSKLGKWLGYEIVCLRGKKLDVKA